MSRVTQIVSKVHDLLQDQDEDDSFILKNLGLAHDSFQMELDAIGLNFDTRVLILPAVPAQTTDLSSFQEEGQLLEDLVVIKELEWRPAGVPNLRWLPVRERRKVLDTDAGTGLTGAAVQSISAAVESYEPRGGTWFISPANRDVDLRVRGDFVPQVIDTSGPNQPVRDSVNILAYLTASEIKFNSGGPTSVLGKLWRDRALRDAANFQAKQIKGQQGRRLRFGSRRRRFLRWGFGAPFEGSGSAGAGGGTVPHDVFDETPAGVIDGANRFFTLSKIPLQNTVRVYLNGQRLRRDQDFTVNTLVINIITTDAPQAGAVPDVIKVDYQW